MIVFLIILVLINAFIILSGRLYLYKGIANTYLKGRSGPSIYDLDVFHSSHIKKGGQVSDLKKCVQPEPLKIPENYRSYLEELDTKAILVMKNNELIYEEYWGEHDENSYSNSFSMSKTIVSLLIGIAVDEGKIGSLDDNVYTYLPEYQDHARKIITIRHLLQMASGLNWIESSANPLSDNAESYYGTNLRGHLGRQKRISEPGEIFNYQSGNSQLLGMIIEKVTGMTLSAYTELKIWSKIGMQGDAYWSLDKKYGIEKAFCCLYANARDYARLGQLILNKGVHDGEQILPRWYYEEMVAENSLSTMEGLPNSRYGLHMWSYRGGEYPVYYCRGIRGQYLICIPEENLLIVRLGTKRKPDFEIPENRKNAPIFVEQNKHKIGHCLGIFEYIALGKNLASQIKD
ncbi:MAG: serine hydrolase [Crocinitomicaceae bacterium]|tara:strand:- start:61854 stop:63062 length:1209 start_codon:yes stop_codon:yes gene_type:complete